MSNTPSVRLFLVSFLVLFLELAIIRWTAANIFYVGYFTNFVLLACFLGIGLGCMGAHWKRDTFRAFPLVLAIFVGIVLAVNPDVRIDISEEIHFQNTEATFFLPMWVLLPIIFASVAALFTCVSQPLSRLLRELPPLKAYTINITGSLCGILGYTIMAFAGMPSPVWFAISLLLYWLASEEPKGKWRTWQLMATFVCVALTCKELFGQVYWSPYYKIRLIAHEEDGKHIGWDLNVNGVGHQVMMPPEQRLVGNLYYTPYAFIQRPDAFKNVLIIGAGSGTDIAVALRHRVDHIDAVEIDPVIVELGREFHPTDPYGDSRVSVHINDGRAFLESTRGQYDMVLFALPDSLTLVSGYSSLRLENFLFTTECFEVVRERLSPDGVVVLYNYYREHWYIQKLAEMLERVFGHEPAVYVWETEDLLPAVLMAGPGLTYLPDEGRAPFEHRETGLKSASDDWPFTYLKRPKIPPQYFLMFALLIPVCIGSVLWARRGMGGGLKRWYPHFFFMGAGFFLLEAKSLVQFALLFGATWLVNSLVFFAILLAILLANLIVSKVSFRRTWPLALALLASVALNFLLPVETLLVENLLVRYVVASTVIFSPIFFANLLFSRFFRDTRAADLGLAANLMGALAGGMMEYASLVAGYQNLMLLVGLFYVLTLLTAPWKELGEESEQ